MDYKKILSCIALTILFSVVFLPFQEVEAFRGSTLERERFTMDPSNDDQYTPSPDPGPSEPAPQDPVEDPDPGPDPAPGDGSDDSDYSGYIPGPSDFRSGRSDRGAYTPPTSPSNPTPPPSDPSPSPDPPPEPEPPQQPNPPSGLTSAEAQAFALLNETRANHNLPPLEIHNGLVETARLKAQDIAENDYFSHVSPTYGSVGQMLRDAGISYNRAAENLSKAGNVSQAHTQLLYSTKGHREIMLSPDYSEVGIGISSLKNVPGIVMVQHYID